MSANTIVGSLLFRTPDEAIRALFRTDGTIAFVPLMSPTVQGADHIPKISIPCTMSEDTPHTALPTHHSGQGNTPRALSIPAGRERESYQP